DVVDPALVHRLEEAAEAHLRLARLLLLGHHRPEKQPEEQEEQPEAEIAGDWIQMGTGRTTLGKNNTASPERQCESPPPIPARRGTASAAKGACAPPAARAAPAPRARAAAKATRQPPAGCTTVRPGPISNAKEDGVAARPGRRTSTSPSRTTRAGPGMATAP